MPSSLSWIKLALQRPMGPAVPIGSYSIRQKSLTPYYKISIGVLRNLNFCITYLLLKLLDLVLHNDLLIVYRQVNFGYSNLFEGLDLVTQDRLVAEVYEWLGYRQS